MPKYFEQLTWDDLKDAFKQTLAVESGIDKQEQEALWRKMCARLKHKCSVVTRL